MKTTDPAAQIVRDIIEANRYLVLATADATGRPWSSPVYFAHSDFTEFFWVSSLDVTHSRNIEVRPEVGIVVFDSQAAIGAGQGVYIPRLRSCSTATRSPGGSRPSPVVRSHTADANGRARASGPAPVCAYTGPPPTRTGSSPRTADPTASPYRSTDTGSTVSYGRTELRSRRADDWFGICRRAPGRTPDCHHLAVAPPDAGGHVRRCISRGSTDPTHLLLRRWRRE